MVNSRFVIENLDMYSYNNYQERCFVFQSEPKFTVLLPWTARVLGPSLRPTQGGGSSKVSIKLG